MSRLHFLGFGCDGGSSGLLGGQELLHLAAPMGRQSIPDQKDRLPAEVFLEILQESDQAGSVLVLEDQPSPGSASFFFNSGQVSLFHTSTASGLRF